MMIANRTKVYLDVCGMKYHFFEPTSLRNMYDLFYILYNMNNIVTEYEGRKEENSQYYLHRSQNRKRLLDYIHFTMRRDYRFDAQTSEFLDELIAYPIERRGQMIWGYYYQLIDSEGISQKIDAAYGKNFRPTEKYFYKTENYSFGEFFRILYTASRLEIFDHNFIKFILASYSMALPAFVENEKRIHKEEQYKHLVDLYGSSLIGINWCDELFGCKSSVTIIKYDNFKYDEPIVNRYEAKRCSIVVNVDQKTSVDVLDIEKLISLLLLSPHWVTGTAIEVEKNNDKWVINAELDPTSFLINCLLINDKIMDKYNADGKHTNADLKIFKYENKLYTLSELIQELYGGLLLSKEEYVKYYSSNVEYENIEITDEFGKQEQVDIPINYLNAYKDLILRIEDGIKVNQTIDIPFRDEKDVPVFEEKDNHKVKQVLIKGTITEIILSYLAQDYRAHHLANMLKHIDLIYNAIKRSITDIVYITSHDVIKKQDRFENAGNPVAIINEFYEKLIKQLADTDKVYFAEGINASHSFKKRFSECAIVNNVFSISRCTEKRILLEAQPVDISNKTYATTLKQVFNDILPVTIYIDYESDFMFALRGHFADSLNDYVSFEQAQQISAIVISSIGVIAVSTLKTNNIEDVNSTVQDEIEKANTEIRKILD